MRLPRPLERLRTFPKRDFLALVGFALATIAMTWPWILNWRNAVADRGDPYISAWTLWWDFHQTFHDPLHLFNANIYYPYHYTLAFGEHCYGIAVLFFPLFALGLKPLSVLSIAILTGLTLSGYGAFRLGFTLTRSYIAAIVTGIVFAYCPYHFFKLGHLHYMFTCWIPLTCEAIVLFSRQRTNKRAAWLGVTVFMNALTCISWLLLTFVPFAVGAIILATKYRVIADRRYWRSGALAITFAVLLLLPFIYPYYMVSREYGFKRSLQDSANFSANVSHWIVPDPRNKLWTSLGLGRGIPASTERWLFPGFAPMLLSLIAVLFLGIRRVRRPLKSPDRLEPNTTKLLLHLLDVALIGSVLIALLVDQTYVALSDSATVWMLATAIAIARCAITVPRWLRPVLGYRLAAATRLGPFGDALTLGLVFVLLGFAGSLGTNFFFHRFLFNYMPLYNSMRVAARWAMICDLGLAILSGLAASLLMRLFESRKWQFGARVVALAIISLILFEQRVAPMEITTGAVDADQLANFFKVTPMKGGIVELPIGADGNEWLYTLRAADHGKPLITGSNSFVPPLAQEIVQLSTTDPIPDKLLDVFDSVPASYVAVYNSFVEPETRVNLQNFLSKALEEHRLTYVRSFTDVGVVDLYAVTKTEPQVVGSTDKPPFQRLGYDPFSGKTNSIDDASFFVRQQYLDFLERDADPEGQHFWTMKIVSCGEDRKCKDAQRTGVATAFSSSLENQENGGFIIRMYMAALGRHPTFEEFEHDRRELTLESKNNLGRLTFTGAWIKSLTFRSRYPATRPTVEVISEICQSAGVSPDTIQVGQQTAQTGDNAIAGILANIANNKDFIDRSRNEVILLSDYFGFLHRDPAAEEFANLLRHFDVNDSSGRQNEVGGFLNSEEYRERFTLKR